VVVEASHKERLHTFHRSFGQVNRTCLTSSKSTFKMIGLNDVTSSTILESDCPVRKPWELTRVFRLSSCPLPSTCCWESSWLCRPEKKSTNTVWKQEGIFQVRSSLSSMRQYESTLLEITLSRQDCSNKLLSIRCNWQASLKSLRVETQICETCTETFRLLSFASVADRCFSICSKFCRFTHE